MHGPRAVKVHIFYIDARRGFTTWERNWRERFLFLKNVATNITAILDATPCNLEGNCRRYRERYCHHLQTILQHASPKLWYLSITSC